MPVMLSNANSATIPLAGSGARCDYRKRSLHTQRMRADLTRLDSANTIYQE
jgi:hypothetical protein